MSIGLQFLQNYNVDSDSDDGIDFNTKINSRKRGNDTFMQSVKKRRKPTEEPDDMDCDESLTQISVTADTSSMSKYETQNPSGNYTSTKSISDSTVMPFNNVTIPLPQEFLTNSGYKDDPSLHQGRIRSFAHERGNWPSYAFLPLNFEGNEPSMTSLLASIKVICQENGLSFIPMEDYHISLSKTVTLRLHWIHPIVAELKKRIFAHPSVFLWLSKLVVYVNDERTRTFLGIEVKYARNELEEIVTAVDSCFKDFKLPTFYKNPSFHVSIGWCNGDCKKELDKLLPSLQRVVTHYFDIENDMRSFIINNVRFKTGNRVHSLPLKLS